MNHADIEFLRTLPPEVFAKLGDITDTKVSRLREIDAIIKCVAQTVKEEFRKRADENRELIDEVTALKARVSQLEALTIRDFERP
jgi:hypothetical protein